MTENMAQLPCGHVLFWFFYKPCPFLIVPGHKSGSVQGWPLLQVEISVFLVALSSIQSTSCLSEAFAYCPVTVTPRPPP